MAGTRAEYEAAVDGLGKLAIWRGQGLEEETVARHLVERRNALKIEFRRGLPKAVLAAIEARNRYKYSHPVGPTADQLFERYGNWRAVSDAACRPARLA